MRIEAPEGLPMTNTTATTEHYSTEKQSLQSLGRSHLPEALATAVDLLKVGDSLLHALGSIEQAAWADHIRVAVAIADAFTVSALVYGDLSHGSYTALDEHIREREAARCEILKEKFGADWDK
ncbi:TPA: hypothetical protein ACLEB8_004890 [Pseudomonas aeruginosa]